MYGKVKENQNHVANHVHYDNKKIEGNKMLRLYKLFMFLSIRQDKRLIGLCVVFLPVLPSSMT